MEKRGSLEACLSATEIKLEPSQLQVDTPYIDVDMENGGHCINSTEGSEDLDISITSADKIIVETRESENTELENDELELENEDSYKESDDAECGFKEKNAIFISEGFAESIADDNKRGLTVKKCGDCGKSYRVAANWQSHKLPRTCAQCERVFTCAVKFCVHEQMHKTTQRPVKQCLECGRNYTWKSHKLQRACTQCERVFTCCIQFSKHKHKHKYPQAIDHTAMPRAHKCPDCGIHFKVATNWKSHTHPRTCSQCHLNFTCERRFNDHELTHTDPQYLYRAMCALKCTDCGVRFTVAKNWKSHTRPQTCSECHLNFTCERRLYEHELTHHSLLRDTTIGKSVESSGTHFPGADASVYKIVNCSHCGMKLPTRSFYLRHMRRHERVHKCLKCDQLFESVAILTEHSTQCGEKQGIYIYMCGDCDMTFENAIALKYHENTHIGLVSNGRQRSDKDKDVKLIAKKPRSRHHVCKECGMVFQDLPSLISHQVQKSKLQTKLLNKKARVSKARVEASKARVKVIVKVKCTQCEKTFDNSRCLSQHTNKAHAEQRTHRCKECGREFNELRYLIEHLRTHKVKCSDERKERRLNAVIKCEVCGITTMSPAGMKIHMNVVHGGEQSISGIKTEKR